VCVCVCVRARVCQENKLTREVFPRRVEASARYAHASRPSTGGGRTYLAKIKLQNQELQHDQKDPVGSRAQELTVSKALEQRLEKLELQMSEMQATNLNLLTQLQVEMTARHRAEEECTRLRTQLREVQMTEPKAS